jgi:hypothetical protein
MFYKVQPFSLVFIILFNGISLKAQITVTNSTFPVAGDKLRMSRDNSPAGIVITPPGFNIEWDLTQLKTDAQYVTQFAPASQGSQGANLPDATLFAGLLSGNDGYYKVTANTFGLVAENGTGPGGDFNCLFLSRPPLVERSAPLNFFDIRQFSSSQLTNIPLDQLSAEFKNGITIDSARLRVAISKIEVVNAYGTLRIPGGSFEVLRVKNTVYREMRLDAKIPPLGWLDVTDRAILYGYNLGVDTTANYQFYSNDSKEPIAILYAQSIPFDDLVITMADFKTIGSTLPVNLESFSAVKNNDHISLTWKTATETNSSRYEIERNIDRRNFSKIGSVTSLNQATGASYRYEDNLRNIHPQQVLYRLKMFDRDERFEYSKIVSLNVGNAGGKIVLLGTGSGRNITVMVPANLLSRPIQADVMNASGILLKRINISNESDQIDLSNLSTGTYFIRFTQGGKLIQTGTFNKR